MRRILTTSITGAALAATVSLGSTAPAAAADGYSLLTTRTEAGAVALRWNPCQAAISYKVHVKYAREKGESKAAARRHARTEIVRAMRQLGAATGLTFDYNGTADDIPTGASWYREQGPSAEVVIAYVNQRKAAGDSTLLASGSWGTGGQVYKVWDSHAAIGRGYVVVDSRRTRSMRVGFGPGSRRGNLLLHELGHVVGLGHVADTHQLMYPQLSDSTPDGFAAGDRAGLRRVGRSAGCIVDASEVWPGS